MVSADREETLCIRPIGTFGYVGVLPNLSLPLLLLVSILTIFLAHLSVDHLSSSSVKVHRGSICTTIRQMGGRSFSNDPLLGDITRLCLFAGSQGILEVLFLVLAVLRSTPSL